MLTVILSLPLLPSCPPSCPYLGAGSLCFSVRFDIEGLVIDAV
jgi:hypothetical protein